MAIYSLCTTPVSRAKGRSAVGSAAYRSGVSLTDERTGRSYDYTGKGIAGVTYRGIVTSDGGEVDRSELWNGAEAAEKRKDARTAREWRLALPSELNARERTELAVAFGQELADRYGVAVDVSVHTPDKEGDQRNHHAHILTTTRVVSRGDDGRVIMGDKASLELSDSKRRKMGLDRAGAEIKAVRQVWREMANGALERAGETARIDERSLADQGITDRQPAVHLGPNVVAMERKGLPPTERAERFKDAARCDALVIDLAEVRRQIVLEEEAQKQQTPDAGTGGQQPAKHEHGGILAAARGERSSRLLSERAKPTLRPREIVLREWRGETDRQFEAVRQKADRIDTYGRHLLAQHERRQEQHRLAKPAEPTGLLAGMRRGAYEVAAKAWTQARDAIQRRIDRLSGQIDALAGYMRRAFPHEAGPTKGEQLAERMAARAQPALAAEYRQQQEQQQMAKDATLYSRADRDVQADRERTERDGKLAANLSEKIEKDAERLTPEAERDKRLQEARDRIAARNERERADREQGKSRGHGR